MLVKTGLLSRLAAVLAALYIVPAHAAPPASAPAGSISKPLSAQMHAMIMAIGSYHEGIPPLRGVQYDVETATKIARKMGVMDSNIRVYRDEELTLDGMKKAFDDLESRVQPDDQVFVYYSGHGGRQRVKEADDTERCAESLVTIDGPGFIDAELEARLKRLGGKAQKLVVLIDACHSGGVTTRALGGSKPQNEEFTPKYFSPKGGMDACAKPVNVLTRSINANLKVPGSGANNYTYIAAARDNEISLDQPGKGGVASQAWLDCMNGDAVDLDGSGSLSADEIRTCAQDKINLKLSKAKGVLPHHVSITGNPDLTIGFAEKSATPAAVPATPASTATGSTGATPPSPARPAAAKPNPMAALKDIFNNRDDRRVVEMKPAKQKLKIGQDAFEFTLKSSHEGHVYLLMVGSDGTSFDLLFPNQIDRDNRIRAGETLKLPRASWELSAQGPVGKDTLLAIVAESPRDFSNIGMQPSGPFSSIDVKENKSGASDIQKVANSSANAGAGECLSAKTRNLAIAKRCSNAYGAALMTVEEVQ